MLTLIGLPLKAKNGEIGTIVDVYFDDKNWRVKYLIVETGSWLFGQKVLIPTVAIIPSINDFNLVCVNLTKGRIRKSPSIDNDRPVSKQQADELFDHHSWPYYGSIETKDSIDASTNCKSVGISATENEDPHLRSFTHVSDYIIYNVGNCVGQTEDLLIDNETWNIPFLVAREHPAIDDTIFIPSSNIVSINWSSFAVEINLTLKQLKNRPKLTLSDI